MATKYKKAQIALLNYIALNELPVGARLPPEKEMAKLCDVSLITIRQALSKLETNQIIRRIHGNGTFLNIELRKSLKLGRLAFISIGKTNEDQFSPGFRVAACEAANRGYALDFIKVSETPEVDLDNDLGEYAGIILYGWVNQPWVDYVNSVGSSTVAVAHDSFNGSIDAIQYDSAQMFELLTERLILAGAQNIGILSPAATKYEQEELRLDGYQRTLRRHGLELNPANWPERDWTVEECCQKLGEFIANRTIPLDGLLLDDSANQLPVLHFYFDHPDIPRPKLGIAKLVNENQQMRHCQLKNTFFAVPERNPCALAVRMIFESAFPSNGSRHDKRSVLIPGVIIGG